MWWHTHRNQICSFGEMDAHLNLRGRQFSPLLVAEMCASAVVMLGTLSSEVVWSGVKGTGYPLHSTVSRPLPLPCVTMCHHVSTGLYLHVFVVFYISVSLSPYLSCISWGMHWSVTMHMCGIVSLLLFGGLALNVYFITVGTVCLCHEGKILLIFWFLNTFVHL